jgi:hypothetical protein
MEQDGDEHNPECNRFPRRGSASSPFLGRTPSTNPFPLIRDGNPGASGPADRQDFNEIAEALDEPNDLFLAQDGTRKTWPDLPFDSAALCLDLASAERTNRLRPELRQAGVGERTPEGRTT